LGREDAETARFAAAAERLRSSSLEVGVVRSLFEPLIDALPNLGILLLLVVGSWRLRSGAVTVIFPRRNVNRTFAFAPAPCPACLGCSCCDGAFRNCPPSR